MDRDSQLRELYQEVILDHNRNPRNFGKLESPTHTLDGFNPLCGDQYRIEVRMEDDRIVDIAFSGSGCAISKASTSIMTQIVKEKSIEESRILFDRFRNLVTRPKGEAVNLEELGKLAVFAQVCDYPSRIKCASLSWHTLCAILNNEVDTVTTE